MSDIRRTGIAIYLAFVACILGVANIAEGNYRELAQRADLKLMVLELKGQSAVIPKFGILRNQKRRIANRIQAGVVLILISLATGTAALVASWRGAQILLGVSGVSLASATYFAVPEPYIQGLQFAWPV